MLGADFEKFGNDELLTKGGGEVTALNRMVTAEVWTGYTIAGYAAAPVARHASADLSVVTNLDPTGHQRMLVEQVRGNVIEATILAQQGSAFSPTILRSVSADGNTICLVYMSGSPSVVTIAVWTRENREEGFAQTAFFQESGTLWSVAGTGVTAGTVQLSMNFDGSVIIVTAPGSSASQARLLRFTRQLDRTYIRSVWTQAQITALLNAAMVGTTIGSGVVSVVTSAIPVEVDASGINVVRVNFVANFVGGGSTPITSRTIFWEDTQWVVEPGIAVIPPGIEMPDRTRLLVAVSAVNVASQLTAVPMTGGFNIEISRLNWRSVLRTQQVFSRTYIEQLAGLGMVAAPTQISVHNVADKLYLSFRVVGQFLSAALGQVIVNAVVEINPETLEVSPIPIFTNVRSVSTTSVLSVISPKEIALVHPANPLATATLEVFTLQDQYIAELLR